MLESYFARGPEKWTAVDSSSLSNLTYNSLSQSLEVNAMSYEPVYFSASGKIIKQEWRL